MWTPRMRVMRNMGSVFLDRDVDWGGSGEEDAHEKRRYIDT